MADPALLEQMNEQLRRRDGEIINLKRQIVKLNSNIELMERSLCKENTSVARAKGRKGTGAKYGWDKNIQDVIAQACSFIVNYIWPLHKTPPPGWEIYSEQSRTLSHEVLKRVSGIIPKDMLPRVCWAVYLVVSIKDIWNNERADSVNRMKVCIKGKETLMED